MRSHPNRSRVAAKAAQAAVEIAHDHEHDYSALLIGVRASFAAAAGRGSLFLTDVGGLNDLYLDSLPAERQTHNCHACRHFIERYGNLVTVSDDGSLQSAMWAAEVPDFYAPAFAALGAAVRKGRITGPLLSDLAELGTSVTGKWSHIAVAIPSAMRFRQRGLTPFQAIAAKKENFRTVANALAELTAPMLDEAIRVLEAGALARSDHFTAPARWLRELHNRPKGRRGENLLWRAVVTAPEGYCHPRASVLAPLLDDIVAGLPFAEIKARFDAKMNPLLYQRPQVAPSAGNIKAAEALVEKLGIADSLKRRFARLDELQTFWRPPPLLSDQPADGVFSHLKPKNASAIRPVQLPPATITWEKFSRTILFAAERIEILVPSHGRFIALTTAAAADATPILKWDRDDARNPVAWYVYPNGSPASQWGLSPGWAKVTGLALFPPCWGNHPMPHLGEGVVAVIEGAVDNNDRSGNGLFPECLHHDLHGIRATVEAYSRSAHLDGRESASACGYDIRKGATDCTIRVFIQGSWSSYRIDRWD